MDHSIGTNTLSSCLLQFSSHYSTQDYKLFEVSDDLLQEILNNPNKTLIIKGDAKRPAVLCTEDKTYSMTKVETSNSVVLMKHDTLEGSVDCFYEIGEAIPSDLDRLFTMLENAYYPQSVYAKEEKRKLSEKERILEFYTTQDLCTYIQASEYEIRSALQQMDAIEINGYWRLVESNYFDEILELILLLVEEKGWMEIPLEQCLDELKNYDQIIVRHILNLLSKEVNNNIYNLDFDKIAIARARSLFKTNSKWKLSDFKNTWQQSLLSLPSYSPDINLLLMHPLCTIEDSYVHFLDLRLLSHDIKLRFKQLFKCKNKWKRKELEAYTRDLIKDNIDATLDKYVRLVQSVTGGENYYVIK